MRHRVKKKAIGRDGAHRKSMVRTMSTQLVEHENITTTLAKAKYLRPYFEKLVTKAKNGSDFNNVKYMKKKLNTKEAVRKMLDDLGPRFKSREGGYTRIVKLGERDGDKAPMARIELVEKPKAKKEKKPTTTKKKTEKKEDTKKEKKPEKKEETKTKEETKKKASTKKKTTSKKKKEKK